MSTISGFSEFLPQIELNEVNVQSIQCKKNKEYQVQPEKHIMLTYSSQLIGQQGLELVFLFELTVFLYEGQERTEMNHLQEDESVFQIEVGLELVYYKEQTQTFTDEIIKELAEQIVAFDAWTYARELVSSLTVRMGYRPFLLPPYRKVTHGG